MSKANRTWIRAAILSLALGRCAAAMATTSYEYVGQPFSVFLYGSTSVYSETNRVTGRLTFEFALAGNLLDAIVVPVDYSFSDGATQFTPDSDNASAFVRVSTDAAGELSAWHVDLRRDGTVAGFLPARLTTWADSSAGDGADANFAGYPGGPLDRYAQGLAPAPGGWTLSTTPAVPEPSAVSMMLVGLIAIGAWRGRQSRT